MTGQGEKAKRVLGQHTSGIYNGNWTRYLAINGKFGRDAHISLDSVLFLSCHDHDTQCSATFLVNLAAISGNPFKTYCLMHKFSRKI